MTPSSVCPGCGSRLLQPLRCEPKRDGTVAVAQRCPECFAWMHDTISVSEVRELDRRQAALRQQLLAVYERCVAESMEALAVCLRAAFERDLVGADDFAPRRVA